MPLKLNTASSGSVTLDAANTASNFTLTVPAQTGTVVASDSSGNVNIDSNTLYVDATNDRVGIGTNSPGNRLEVNGIVKLTPITYSSTPSSSYGGFLQGVNDGSLRVDSYNPTGNSFLSFGTNASSAAIVERMRIDYAGQVFVKPSTGGTGYTAGDSGLYSDGGFGNTLRLGNTYGAGKGFAAFYNGSTAIGSINAATASSTSYVTTSDYRLKENIAPMTDALEKVSLLKPCTYIWKLDGSQGQGFIAHELQEVVPECVVGEKDAVEEDGSIKAQGIDTSFLVATLTAAIQELKAEVDSLKSEVTALKGQA